MLLVMVVVMLMAMNVGVMSHIYGFFLSSSQGRGSRLDDCQKGGEAVVSHAKSFTPRGSYTATALHTEAFGTEARITQRHFDTELLLHTKASTHRSR